MAWALLAQHYGRLNTTTGYVAYIYWICGVCHAANVQTEGMVLIFIYYYVRVRTHRTARALRAARSVALIHAHSNNKTFSPMVDFALDGKRDTSLRGEVQRFRNAHHRVADLAKDLAKLKKLYLDTQWEEYNSLHTLAHANAYQ